MSKPKGKRAGGTSTQTRQAGPSLTLGLARKMLPLVSRIVEEIRDRWNRLTKLEAEQLDLDHRRRNLGWPERSRRYQVAEEISSEHHHLQDAVAELEVLEVVLVDPVLGEAAFPTTISGRRGYFVWRAGRNDIDWWCYANEPTRHAIPGTWRLEKT